MKQMLIVVVAAENVMMDEIYARGYDINQVFRFAPQVVFTYGKLKFYYEVSYINAEYGDIDSELNIKNINPVGMVRNQFLAVYSF